MKKTIQDNRLSLNPPSKAKVQDHSNYITVLPAFLKNKNAIYRPCIDELGLMHWKSDEVVKPKTCKRAHDACIVQNFISDLNSAIVEGPDGKPEDSKNCNCGLENAEQPTAPPNKAPFYFRRIKQRAGPSKQRAPVQTL